MGFPSDKFYPLTCIEVPSSSFVPANSLYTEALDHSSAHCNFSEFTFSIARSGSGLLIYAPTSCTTVLACKYQPHSLTLLSVCVIIFFSQELTFSYRFLVLFLSYPCECFSTLLGNCSFCCKGFSTFRFFTVRVILFAFIHCVKSAKT